MRLWVNGLNVRTVAATGSITINTAPLNISGFNDGVGQIWNGLLDEVRIYNRTLSAAEIQAIYAATK
jgi:hypothetical protein